MTPTELLQQRAKHIADARAIVDQAKAGGRDLSAEETAHFDKLMDEAAKLKAQADAEQVKADRADRLREAEEDLTRPRGRISRPGRPGAHNGHGPSTHQPYAFDAVRYDAGRERRERIVFDPGTPAWQRHQPENRDGFRGWLRSGQISAALQTDSDTAGGYLTMPEQFVAELIKDVDDLLWIRQLARTFTTTAQTLGAPKRTTRMSAFGWGSELSDAENTADSALAFGKRSLTPHYMTGSILVSRDLMRAAVMDPEAIVRYEMARDSGELEEDAFLTGSGAGRPLGLFTASNDGISTGRDVSTGNTTTELRADNLREVKYKLKAQYRSDPTLRWLFHRDAVKQISKLKDGEGQYLWKPGISDSDPDRLLAIPFAESERAPNTFTTGQYVGLLGAFRFYWIVDALFMDMQRLVETYAKTNQIQFIARRKVDGMPQVEEAFARVKLA